MITDLQAGVASKRIEMFQQSCGLHSIKNVAIITTMWDKVTSQTGEQQEEKLKALFESSLDFGAVTMRHDGTLKSATAIINQLLEEHTTLEIAYEVENNSSPLEETAGAEKNKIPIKMENSRTVNGNTTPSAAEKEPSNEPPGHGMMEGRKRNGTGCVLTSNSVNLEQ